MAKWSLTMLRNKSWGKEGVGGGSSEWWILFSQETSTCDESGFSGSGWTSACQWEAESEFFFLFCLHAQLLLYIVKSLSTHKFSHFCLFDSFPHSTCREWVSGCVVLSCLLGLNHNNPQTYLSWKWFYATYCVRFQLQCNI